MAQTGSARGPQHPMIKGRNGAGGIPLPGARVGERVIDVIRTDTTASEASSFETTISVSGQLQQASTSDLSGREYWAITV